MPSSARRDIAKPGLKAVAPGVKAAAPAALTALLIGLAWWGAFGAMWARWFPAWHRTDLALLERLSQGETYYRHGPAAVAVSLALAWLVWRRQGVPGRPTASARCVGGVMLTAALALHVVSAAAGVTFTSGFALVGVLLAMALLIGGWATLRAYGPVVTLLLCAVPLPMVWIAQLNFELKQVAVSAAVWLVAQLTGVQAMVEGSRVSVLGPGGLTQWLLVDSACSGLRSLVALVWVGAVLAVVAPMRAWSRVMLLALAGPVALGANVVRVAVMIVVAQWLGAEAVAASTAAHQWLGVMMFVMALGAMLGLERSLVTLWPAAPRPSIERGSARIPMSVMTLLTLVCATVLMLGLRDRDVPHHVVPYHHAPSTLTLDGHHYIGTDHPVNDELRLALGSPAILHRQYTAPTNDVTIDLAVVQHPDDRQAIHPPEVCLAGLGHRLVAQRDRTVTIDGQPVAMRELVTEHRGARYAHLYAYRIADRYTTSYTDQQWRTVLHTFRGDDASAALLRITVRGTGVRDESLSPIAAQLFKPD